MKPFWVLIDPGHGGEDPGAPGDNPIEAAINLDVALILSGILEHQGVFTWLTREKDETVSLRQRCLIENKLDPALFVSLHCNAAENSRAEGMEVWTSPGETLADKAATNILWALQDAFPNRRFRYDFADGDGDKEARFHVLTHTRCPAVLVEAGFVSNPKERQWLLNRRTQVQMALALTEGIMASVEMLGAKR